MKLFFFRIISVVTFFIFPTTQVYAECIVNSVSYDVGGRTGSGVTAINRSKPIDLSIIRSHASAWNNIIDDVTTCDVSNFNSMAGAFRGNSTFNQDISAWDVSNVNNMYAMFAISTNFNQDISAWDVSNVNRM